MRAALTLLLLALVAQEADARPPFARREQKACGYCHINPRGGGARNQTGLLYARNEFSFPPRKGNLNTFTRAKDRAAMVRARKLMDVTWEAMMLGIGAVRPGAHLGDIGHAIQSFVEPNRFSVVRDFCGHGIGRIFHTAPSVMHYGRPGHGLVLREGMFFTIEPMINAGRFDTKILGDGWTAVTKDKSLSAQFEHMLGVTADGCEIFTESPAGLHCPPYDI